MAGVAFVVWNIITFCIYGLDKRRAGKNKRRISESALITCAFLMGAAGALLGMKIFRHKTKHLRFKLLVPLALVFNAGVVAAVFWALQN